MSDRANDAISARTTAEDGSGTAVGDGRLYWRSMEQLADLPEYRQFVEREFLDDPDRVPADAVSRRRFLSLVAAAVAMAGTTACRKPYRKILPFSRRPEDMTPGMPRYYATSLELGGYGTGVLVRSSDGRPTKVEGNELHPASLGGSDAYMQGELLNLYDPARSKNPVVEGEEVDRQAFDVRFARFRREMATRLGEGDKLAFLMRPTTSPTLHHMVKQVKGAFPKAAFHVYSPVNRDNAIEGSRLAFGSPMDPQYRFDLADVVVAFDSDFLSQDVGSVRHARDFASRRRPGDGANGLNRLYVVEPGLSITGGQADHRFRMRAHEVGDAVFALAAELGVLKGELGRAVEAHKQHGFRKRDLNWVAILASDLLEPGRQGKSLLVAGPRQPAVVHAVVLALNEALGNVGKTVSYVDPPALAAENQLGSLRVLAEAMDHDRVDTLFVLGANPIYDAPADIEFADKLAKVPHRVHVGAYRDETALACNWHINAAHELEAWGDIRSYDGTAAIVQPLIAPLYHGMSPVEVLAVVADYDEKAGYDIVRYYWVDQSPSEGFDALWNRALHDGLIHGSAPAARTPRVDARAVAAAAAGHKKAPVASRDNLEVTFAQDALIYDGRYANNAWMQECPDPVTKLTWDNVAVMSQRTASELGVSNGDLVDLALGGRRLEMPAWIVPGHADHSIALSVGYGRDLAGFDVARGAGFDTYALRHSGAFHMGMELRATATGRKYPLASTQNHGSLEGRDHYRQSDLAGFLANPSFAPQKSPLARAAALQKKPDGTPKSEADLLKSLWQERDYSTGYQWGMVIDLNSCNGCNACVVACQAENNIPSVGKDEVKAGREMHWIRVDRYFTSAGAADAAAVPDAAGVAHQPVPCMQCENAPCESVCPVAATVHSPEGLNDMAYNRCIGTRYCSNNCPYKVRRFNWFDFIGKLDPTLQMVQNPDVTIRSRGVMEKCTYCVQRINGAKHAAKREGRRVLDGEIAPACAQACPSRAITFGNIADPESAVSKLRASTLNYAMLSELNVKPRTTYLAKVTNPNPQLA